MDPDISLIIGLFFVVVAIPAIVSDFADGRRPRSGTLLLIAGIALSVYAYMTNEGGYAIAEIPDVLFRVIGRLIG